MKPFILLVLLGALAGFTGSLLGLPVMLAGAVGICVTVGSLPICMAYLQRQKIRRRPHFVRLGRRMDQGFGLVELMIVIAIASAVVFFRIATTTNENEQATRIQNVREAADRYHVVYNAVTQWVTENRGDWDVDVMQTISGNYLAINGYLPPSFAPNEAGTVHGYTPWNTLMRVFAIKDADDHVRALITERNAIDLGTARKMGIELDDTNKVQQSESLARELALAITSIHNRVTGYIPADELVAIGLQDRFNFDITAWEAVTRDTGRVVMLWGFPEYGVSDGTGPLSVDPFNFVDRECDLFPAEYAWVSTSYEWVSGVCPIDRDEEGRVPVCAEGGHASGLSASIGYAIHGRWTEYTDANNSPTCQAPGCAGKQNRTTFGSFSLGGAPVWQDVCFATEWQNRPVWDPAAPVEEWVLRSYPDSTITHAYCCDPVD